jgi:hypothetical protein
VRSLAVAVIWPAGATRSAGGQIAVARKLFAGLVFRKDAPTLFQTPPLA